MKTKKCIEAFGYILPLVLCAMFLFSIQAIGIAAADDVIDTFDDTAIGKIQCSADSAFVWADVDQDGTYDTQVVLTPVEGEASVDKASSQSDYQYHFSFMDSLCGGGGPPWTGKKGKLEIYFVDMLDPGFVSDNPETWVQKSIPFVSMKTYHGIASNGNSDPQLDVEAYRNVGQLDPLSGNSAQVEESRQYDFYDALGIMELYVSTDFSENSLDDLILGLQPIIDNTEEASQEAATSAVLPDLIIYSLTAPATGGAGQTIQVTDTTKNQGTAASVASTTKFYLSTNAIWDAGDAYLGQRAVPALAAGASNGPANTSVTIPLTSAGSFYIIAKADADGNNAESNENNNTKSKMIKIGPDLIVSTIVTNPSSPLAGQNVTVTVTVKNQGGGAAGSFFVDIYKHLTSAPLPGQVGDAYCSIAGLAAGATTTCVKTVNYASGGTYTMWSQVDTELQVPETVETNNTKSKSITVKTPLPDLIVTGITTTPFSPLPYQNVTVKVTVKNQGTGAIPDTQLFWVDIYKNRATAPSPGQYGDAYCTHYGLGVGESKTCERLVQYDSGGTYTMWAQVDSGAHIAETNETNNTKSKSITIQTPKPDLIVSALDAPATGGAGQTIQVTDTTKNQGAGAAVASNTKFYLSTNFSWDAGDILFCQRAVPALASGASSGPTITNCTIPAGTVGGSYYIIAKADADNVNTETNETNNTKSKLIKIGPDLIVSSIVTNPASPLAGQNVTVTVTVKNQGGGGAGGFYVDIYKNLPSAPSPHQVGDAYCLIGGLLAGDTTTCVKTLTYSSAGTYTMWSQVDTNQQVSETLETNNTKSKYVTLK